MHHNASLTFLKSGVRPIQVSRELRDWREASMASGNWNGGAGDNNNVVARPTPRKKEPGTRTGWQPSSTPRGGPTKFGIFPLVNIDLICMFIAFKLP